jgi:hypothetical protein
MDTFFSTVLTSAIVATVVGAVINAWLESRKSRSTTRMDALTAAVALEGYAIGCADRLQDHENAVSSDGHAGQYLVSVPTLPEVRVVAGFLKPRRASVANRLLAFPQEVLQADQEAAFWWDVVGDHDATGNVATLRTAEMGLQSLALAADLRSAFDLPSRTLVFGEYDIRQVLEKQARLDHDESDVA